MAVELKSDEMKVLRDEFSEKCKNRFIPDPKTCMEKWPSRCSPRTAYSAAGAVITFILIAIVLLDVRDLTIAVAIIGGIVFFATLRIADYA